MRLFYTLAAFLAVPVVAAQAPAGPGSVRGSVADGAEGLPLPSATVSLWTPSDSSLVTGTTTGADGAFAFEGLALGAYELRVSFVGYEPARLAVALTVAAPTADLGRLAIEPDAAALAEVEVGAERALVEQRADRTVYNVSEQPVAAGGSASETLEVLPSIEVDAEGNVSYRGSRNVAIHIDGRPAPVSGAMLAAYLRQIPAENVQRVEVVANPSARDEPDGMSGIINIVLKERTDRGLSGGLTLVGGSAMNVGATGRLAYQDGPFDVNASYSYRRTPHGHGGTTQREALASGALLDQTLVAEHGMAYHFVQGGVAYDLTEHLSAFLDGFASTYDHSNEDVTESLFLGGARRRVADGAQDGRSGGASLVLRHRPREGDKLDAELYVAQYPNLTETLYSDTDPAGVTAERVAEDWTNGYQRAKVDLVRSIGPWTLEAGASGIAEQSGNGVAYEVETGDRFALDSRRSGGFDYTLETAAAYAQAAVSAGPWRAQAGLRAETAAWTLEAETVAPVETSYRSLFPSAFLTYVLRPGTSARLSYSRRIERPSAWTLNPVATYEDTLHVNRGNPALTPEYTDAFELTVDVASTLTLTPFYRRTTDVIRRQFDLDPVTQVLTSTWANRDVLDSYGADASLSGQALGVRGLLSGSVYRAVAEDAGGLGSDGLGWSVSGNLRWNVLSGTQIQVFGRYTGPQILEQGRQLARGSVTLAASHAFGDDLSLSLRMADVFGTSRYGYRTTTDDYVVTTSTRYDQPFATATLSYTFGRPPRPDRPSVSDVGGGGD